MKRNFQWDYPGENLKTSKDLVEKQQGETEIWRAPETSTFRIFKRPAPLHNTVVYDNFANLKIFSRSRDSRRVLCSLMQSKEWH